MTATNIVLVITALCTALIAGLLYSYSCSVMLGLRSLPDAGFIATMQSINRAIQNPLFFISFMGTLFLLPISTYMNYTQPLNVRFWMLLIATVLYITGVLCVTAFGNIPLNDTLDKFNLLNATADTIRSHRAAFENSWNNFHTIRTIAAIICLVLVIVGCISPGKS